MSGSNLEFLREIDSSLLVDFDYDRSLFEFEQNSHCLYLRWLDLISKGQYLPSLSIDYVAINNDIVKRSPLLYYIKMKICYD